MIIVYGFFAIAALCGWAGFDAGLFFCLGIAMALAAALDHWQTRYFPRSRPAMWCCLLASAYCMVAGVVFAARMVTTHSPAPAAEAAETAALSPPHVRPQAETGANRP